MARDITPAAQVRAAKALADCGGDRDAALLLLATLLEAALIGTSAGLLRLSPPPRD